MLKWLPIDYYVYAIIVGISPLLIQTKILPDTIIFPALSIIAITLIALMIVISLYEYNGYAIKRSLIYITVALVFAFSFCWGNAFAFNLLSKQAFYVDQTIEVEGHITSPLINEINNNPRDAQEIAPSKNHFYQSSLSVDIIDNQSIDPIKILITSPHNYELKDGQRWKLRLKMRAIHGRLNEGSFDVQRFMLSRHYLIKGTIQKAILINEQSSLRQIIADKMVRYVEHSNYQGLIFALGLGDKQLLSSEHKTALFQTGLSHLLAVSGMHIVLIYLFFVYGFKLIQHLFSTRRIGDKFPIIMGIMAALFYGGITGWSPPTSRALLALIFWLLLRWFKQSLSTWQILFRIMAILLMMDPMLVLSESFWLSCYAVFCLIFIAHWFPLKWDRSNSSSIWYYCISLIYLQGLLILLLIPIQILLFNGFSYSSILANLFAIPVISFLIMPLIILVIIFSLFASGYPFFDHLLTGLVSAIDTILSLLFSIIDFLTPYYVEIHDRYLYLSLIGWVALIFWRMHLFSVHIYWIVIMAILSLIPLMKVNDKKTVRMDMLDIGHGLAVVISQNGRALLYDTGATGGSRTMAEQHIVPFLKYHRLVLDGIIISHEHDDHIGGLSVLQKIYPSALLMSSSSQLDNQYNCLSGQQIQWQSVTLNALWPNALSNTPLNPDSCVVKLTFDGLATSVLLTGDLERAQELELVKNSSKELKSTLLQVPHHGSRTSSTYAFLGAVKPEVLLNSTSRYNPWRLPHPNNIKRYEELGLPFLNTADTGQIQVLIDEEGWQLKRYRDEINPKWYHDAFGSFTKKR